MAAVLIERRAIGGYRVRSEPASTAIRAKFSGRQFSKAAGYAARAAVMNGFELSDQTGQLSKLQCAELLLATADDYARSLN